MHSPKEFFLDVMGVDGDYPHTVLLTHDVAFRRENEREPFGELITTKEGKTILRIGAVMEDGIKVIV